MQINTLSFKYTNENLHILDQTQLPHKEVWLEIKSPNTLVKCIKSLQIRGAPLIGIVAGLSLGTFANKTADWSKVKKAGLALRGARPTAVNLMKVVDELLSLQDPSKLLPRAIELAIEDREMCEQIGKFGSSIIQPEEGIIHYCNTGQLATAGIGTALGVIHRAHEEGKNIHVYVSETRPLLQGARLTVWELEKMGCPYTLICDNMVGSLMHAGKINRCLVGADRIALNGDFANKIGTYSLAVIAHYHSVDFHPVAPTSTIDFECSSKQEIPIEFRSHSEIIGHSEITGQKKGNSEERKCYSYNPAFDTTPANLYTSMVLNTGVLTSEEIQNGQLAKLKETLL